MKKILTLAFVILFTLNNYAQISISDGEGNSFDDGVTYNLPLEENYDGIPYIVTNNSAAEITILIEAVIWANAGDVLAVCGNGSCVTLGAYEGVPKSIGTNPTTLAPSGSTTAENTHIQCLGTPLLGDYLTIRVYEQGNESNSVTFTLDTETTSVVSYTSNQLINVYPNPATDYFTVKVSSEHKGSQLVFTNLLGKVVLRKSIDNSELNISTNQFPGGVYFYSLIDNGIIIETKKLIIK